MTKDIKSIDEASVGKKKQNALSALVCKGKDCGCTFTPDNIETDVAMIGKKPYIRVTCKKCKSKYEYRPGKKDLIQVKEFTIEEPKVPPTVLAEFRAKAIEERATALAARIRDEAIQQEESDKIWEKRKADIIAENKKVAKEAALKKRERKSIVKAIMVKRSIINWDAAIDIDGTKTTLRELHEKKQQTYAELIEKRNVKKLQAILLNSGYEEYDMIKVRKMHRRRLWKEVHKLLMIDYKAACDVLKKWNNDHTGIPYEYTLAYGKIARYEAMSAEQKALEDARILRIAEKRAERKVKAITVNITAKQKQQANIARFLDSEKARLARKAEKKYQRNPDKVKKEARPNDFTTLPKVKVTEKKDYGVIVRSLDSNGNIYTSSTGYIFKKTRKEAEKSLKERFEANKNSESTAIGYYLFDLDNGKYTQNAICIKEHIKDQYLEQATLLDKKYSDTYHVTPKINSEAA